MELKIKEEKENALYGRNEIAGIIVADIAPNKQDVASALSKKYSVPVNAIRVLIIKGKFGIREFTLKANIYKSNEERNKFEQMSKKEKEAEAKAAEKLAGSEQAQASPASEETSEREKAPAKSQENTDEKSPAEEAIGHNPVEEAKKVEDKKEEEDKKEKEKSPEEKLNEAGKGKEE